MTADRQMRSAILADGVGQTLPQKGVETLLLVGFFVLAWAAIRVRDARLLGHRGIPSRALAVMAAAALVLAFVVPSMLGAKIASVRPSTTATLMILSPRPRQLLRGNPAVVRVRLRLVGARIVAGISTHLVPDQGHIHLYLDGILATMTYATSTTIYAYPASHRLEAQFVAVDHGPFSPPVTASVQFTVVP